MVMEPAETMERLRKLVAAFASVDPQPDLHTVCPWCERSEHHEGDCPWILANAEVWFDGDIAHGKADLQRIRDRTLSGPSDVKGERMGLSPLAVKELAEEFRRLAAEAKHRVQTNELYGFPEVEELTRAATFEQAAQMLEEKLNG